MILYFPSQQRKHWHTVVSTKKIKRHLNITYPCVVFCMFYFKCEINFCFALLKIFWTIDVQHLWPILVGIILLTGVQFEWQSSTTMFDTSNSSVLYGKREVFSDFRLRKEWNITSKVWSANSEVRNLKANAKFSSIPKSVLFEESDWLHICLTSISALLVCHHGNHVKLWGWVLSGFL
jgi:hypothetical protein